jgi:hypothetical protein
MKKSIVVLLIIFVFAGCAGNKKVDGNSLKIEYKAYSKSFYQIITVENQIAFITKNRDEKPVAFKISSSEWNSLKSIIQELDLEAINKWNAPTDKRLFDGAAIATLKITKQGKVYESQSFDHDNPPLQINKTVTKILSLVNLKKKKTE